MNESWIFDEAVASRFQHEAESHIPSYNTVINKSVDFAKKNLQPDDLIIDVGSALGFTINKFKSAGFKNVIGVDNSTAMIEKSLYSDTIVHSSTLPVNKYKLVLINWTLHFILDKQEYLQSVYNSLDNGYLILTDKMKQSDKVKEMYYDFKRNNGVADEYIYQKEDSLKTIMHCKSVEWYTSQLTNIGFDIEIIHADLGFVTFLCYKNNMILNTI
jgi:trans-aconitate methyltransferase